MREHTEHVSFGIGEYGPESTRALTDIGALGTERKEPGDLDGLELGIEV